MNDPSRSQFTPLARFVTVVGLVLTFCASPARGQDAENEDVSQDTCVLELTLPEGATVTVDGRDYGTNHQLTYRRLQPGKTYTTTLEVTLPDGTREERKVRISGGRRVQERFGPPSADQPVPPTAPPPLAQSGPELGPNHDKPELVLQSGHPDMLPDRATLSPDGQHLATASLTDHVAILWDTTTGRKLRCFQGHSDCVSALAFSPDGRRLATGSHDNTAIVWDVVSGRRLQTFSLSAWVNAAAFDPHGRYLLLGCYDSTASLWDTTTGEKVRTFNGHTGMVNDAAFSPDGRQMVTASDDDTAALWDVSSGRRLQVFRGHAESVERVAFHPNGRQVLTASGDATLILWDAATARQIQAYKDRNNGLGFKTLTFSPDGGRIASCSYDGMILWDAVSGQAILKYPSYASCLAFSQEGQRIVTGWNDGRIVITDAAAEQKPYTIQAHSGRVSTVVFSPDGRQVLSLGGSLDGTAYGEAVLWDMSTGQRLGTFRAEGDGTVSSLTCSGLSPDGLKVLTGWGRSIHEPKYTLLGEAILWDATTGEKLQTLNGHNQYIAWCQFSINGDRLLTGAYDNTVILWDLTSARKLLTLEGHASAGSVALSHDGAHLLESVAGTPNAVLWNAATGEKVCDLIGNDAPATCVAVSPDGRQALTGLEDGAAVLWNVTTGEKVRRLEGHTEPVSRVEFSPDGRYAVTSSHDERSTILWDAETGARRKRFPVVLGSPMWSPTEERISPDSRWLAGLTLSGLTLWDIGSGRKVRGFGSHSATVAAMFGPQDQPLVLCLAGSGGLCLRGPLAGDAYESMPTSDLAAQSAVASPDGQHVLTTHLNSLVLWDFGSGRIERVFPTLRDLGIWTAVFSHDGRQILAAYMDNTAVLWDATTGKRLHTFIGHKSRVSAIAISPDGQYVFTGTDNEAAILWEAATGKKLHVWTGEDANSAAFSPDGREVLVGDDSGNAVFYEVASGKKVRAFQGQSGFVESVAFSPDGREVLTGNWTTDGHRVTLWDRDSGKQLRQFQRTRGDDDLHCCAAFSPDGRRIVVGYSDGPLIVWDATTGERLQTFAGHTAKVNSVAFGSEGRDILSAADDGTVRLWDAATGHERASIVASFIDQKSGRVVDWVATTPEGNAVKDFRKSLMRFVFRDFTCSCQHRDD